MGSKPSSPSGPAWEDAGTIERGSRGSGAPCEFTPCIRVHSLHRIER